MVKRKDTEVVKVAPEPEFLTNYVEDDHSLETLERIKVLNRLAVIQSNSKREKKEAYGEGSLAIPAAGSIVATKGEAFDFVPVFFFEEFCLWSDQDDTQSRMIIERSMDPTSELAQRSMDFDRMRENYTLSESGEQLVSDSAEAPFTRRYVHHLNFFGVVYGDHPLKGTPVVVSFNRSDYKTGERLVQMLKMRRLSNGKRAPMWSAVLSLSVGDREDKKGHEWYGIDFANAENPWVEAQDADMLKAMSEEMLEDWKNDRIGVGHEEASDKTVEAEVGDGGEEF